MADAHDGKARLSLDTLCAIISFWPTRIPLSFVAAQPRCRLSAEAHAAHAGGNALHVCRGVRELVRVNKDALAAQQDYDKERDDDSDGVAREGRRNGLVGTTPHTPSEGVAAAWDVWAAQLPFREWWVSDLAERVMPAERVLDGEAHFMDEAVDEVSDGQRGTGVLTAAHLFVPSPPPLAPAAVSEPLRTLPGLSGSLRITRRRATYYARKAHCFARRRQYQSGVLDTAADDGRAPSCAVSWPDCPYPSDGLWSVSVRSGFAGGVRVGRVVSFLVSATDDQEEGECHLVRKKRRQGCSCRGGGGGGDGAEKEKRHRVPFYRVLHWDVEEEKQRERARHAQADTRAATTAHSVSGSSRSTVLGEPCAVNNGSGSTDVMAASADPLNPSTHLNRASPDTTAFVPLPMGSAVVVLKETTWTYSHWWFCRPLCWGRRPALTCASHDGEGSTLTNTLPPPSDVGVAPTTLYVYGSHPAELPRLLEQSCDTPGCSNPSACHGCGTPAVASPLAAAQCTGFVEAVRFYACSSPWPLAVAPAPFTTSTTTTATATATANNTEPPSATQHSPAVPLPHASRRLQRWLVHLQQTSCCAHLTRLELNMEDCDDNDEDDESPLKEAHDSALHTGGTRAAASLQEQQQQKQQLPLSHFSPSIWTLSAVHLSGSTLRDVNVLGQLPCLRLADLSLNTRLTDAGVRGLGASTSLSIIDLSYCARVNDAAVALAGVATLQELYLSGTALTDATLAAMATQLWGPRSAAGETERDDAVSSSSSSSGGGDGVAVASQLQVLHVSGCRQLKDPFGALAIGHVEVCREEGEREVWWRHLVEFRTSSTTIRRPTRKGVDGVGGGKSEEEEEEEEKRGDRDATAGAGEGMVVSGAAEATGVSGAHASSCPTGSNDCSIREGSTHEGFRLRSPSGPPAHRKGFSQPRLGQYGVIPLLRWSALTTLVLSSTTLHCPLSGIGVVMPCLERLSLLRCSTVAPADGSDASGSEVDEEDDDNDDRSRPHRSLSPRRQPHPSPPWLDGVQHCSLLHTVQLDESDAGVTRVDSLRLLAQLPSLTNLSLHRTRVCDEDIRAFVDALRGRYGGGRSSTTTNTITAATEASRLLSLSSSSSSFPPASPPQLVSLVDCPLRRVCITLCSRLAHIAELAALPSLHVLEVSDTAAQQDMVNALSTCTTAVAHRGGAVGTAATAVVGGHSLQVFKASACPFLVNANPLAALRQLRWLDLSHTPLATAEVAELRHCPCLTHLNLKGCAGVTHVRDVLAIATLEVLNAQGTGLRDDGTSARDRLPDDGGARAVPSHSAPTASLTHDVPFNAPDSTAVDVFPSDDAVLRRSVLHTLLLSHTRVCRIHRLGLMPALACLDITATAVSDVELVRFVCTGLQQSAQPDVLSSHSPYTFTAAQAAETHPDTQTETGAFLREVRATQSLLSCPTHSQRGGPPLRVLSAQLCRSLFTVGILGLCPRLVKLDLSGSNVTSRGLVGLQRSRSLRQLRLQACKGVHDMRVLGCVASLREVDGSGSNVYADRLMTGFVWGCGAGSDTLRGMTEPTLPPMDMLRTHSDIYRDVKCTSDLSVLTAVVEGRVAKEVPATRDGSVPSAALPMLRRVLSCSGVSQLRRVVLDGCANITVSSNHDGGGGGGGGLRLLSLVCPSLLELSLCNCSGVTAHDVAELSGGLGSGTGDDGATCRGCRVCHLCRGVFPSLRILRLSSCRSLTGALDGWERLPQLRRVYLDHSGVTSLTDVVAPLQPFVII